MTLIRLLFISVLLIFSLPQNYDEDYCNLKNTSFKEGEKITYKIYYTLVDVFVEAGEVNFLCNLEQLNNKPVYHLIATGTTLPFYDHFYKVRDRYESYTDTETLRPLQFTRNTNEGGAKKYENIRFNQAANTAITDSGVLKIDPCMQDALSAVYYLRNVKFVHINKGDKIPFTIILDSRIYHTYIRYIGKEILKTKYGRFHTIKFKAMLIKGTLFEEGEKMTVWVSDDSDHLPLRVESAIVIGSVKADMMEFQNLRTPLESQIH
jgi:hypothetical protein